MNRISNFFVVLLLGLVLSGCATSTRNIALEAGQGAAVYERPVFPAWRKMAVSMDVRSAREAQLVAVPLSPQVLTEWQRINQDNRAIQYPLSAVNAEGRAQVSTIALRSLVSRVYLVQPDGSYAPSEAVLSPSGRQLMILLPAGTSFVGMSAFIRSDRGDYAMTTSGAIIPTRGKSLSEVFASHGSQSVISRTTNVARGDGSGFFEYLDTAFPDHSRIGGIQYSGAQGTFCASNNGWCDQSPVTRGEGGRFPSIAALYTREDTPGDRWVTCGDGNVGTGLLSVIGLGFFAANNVNAMFIRDRC